MSTKIKKDSRVSFRFSALEGQVVREDELDKGWYWVLWDGHKNTIKYHYADLESI